jgi:hypothetical protein
MSKFAALFTLLVAVLTCGLLAAPAQAQRARVFVASYGSDSNPCTFGSPCKTFQHAVNVVAESGEVTAIDSAGFGSLVINKGVTITSPNGIEAGVVTAAGGTAIAIAAQPNEAVVLRGLTIAGGNSAAIGVDVQTEVGKIEIVDCVIRDFQGEGINLFSPASAQDGTMLVHISNTKVMNNAGSGIVVTSDPGGIVLDLNNVTVVDNNQSGITLQGTVAGTIANSDISNNGSFEVGGCNVIAGSTGSAIVGVTLRNLTLGSTGGPSSVTSCSITLNGHASVNMSQLVGGFLTQQNSSNFAFSDGTNQFVSSSSPVTPQPWSHF